MDDAGRCRRGGERVGSGDQQYVLGCRCFQNYARAADAYRMAIDLSRECRHSPIADEAYPTYLEALADVLARLGEKADSATIADQHLA